MCRLRWLEHEIVNIWISKASEQTFIRGSSSFQNTTVDQEEPKGNYSTM